MIRTWYDYLIFVRRRNEIHETLGIEGTDYADISQLVRDELDVLNNQIDSCYNQLVHGK